MTKEFKKTFFTSLLVVLLIVSNLIGLKLTNFLNLTISVNFITYPFTFLCTLLILNMGGKKSAYQAILISAIIQIFITISYTLAVSLGTQSVIPDSSVYVNELFKVKDLNIIASLIAFLVSHYVLIYIFDCFLKVKKELYGVVVGLLGSLFLNSAIYLFITLYEYETLFIVNMLLSNILISIIMVIIITILYFILKEKDKEIVEINSMNINVNKYSSSDKSIEEVLNNKETKEKKKTNNKSYYKKTNNSKTNNKSSKTRTNNKTNNKRKNSQVKVKKTENSKKNVKSVDK